MDIDINQALEKVLQRYFFTSAIDALPALLELAERKNLAPGQVFTAQGSYSPKVALILSGTLRGYYLQPEGDEITYIFREQYQIMGCWEPIFLQKPTNHTIAAVEPSVILSINYPELVELVQQDPAVERIYHRAVHQVFAESLSHYQTYVNEKPEQRYLRLRADNPGMVGRIPQKYLASYLGITPVSLSRLKKRLEKN